MIVHNQVNRSKDNGKMKQIKQETKTCSKKLRSLSQVLKLTIHMASKCR